MISATNKHGPSSQWLTILLAEKKRKLRVAVIESVTYVNAAFRKLGH